MAIEPERKVSRGDRLQIPAATYNSLIDMLRAYKRNKALVGAQNPASTIISHNTVLVKNLTGIDLIESFKILRLSDIITDLQDDPYAFSKRPVFGGYIPQTEDDAIAITSMPAVGIPVIGSESGLIDSGPTEDIIPAVISGITLALVKLNNLTDEWANPTPDNVDYLTSASTGQARILYWEDLQGSLLEGSVPDDVVLGVVNLIGSKSKAFIRLKRDNNTDGCMVYDGTDPESYDTIAPGYYYHIINNNTGPSNTVDTNNRRILWRPGASGEQSGPQLYIPANSGRVIVFPRILLLMWSEYDDLIPSYGLDGSSLSVSGSYDIVNVDENGDMHSITLYNESGGIEWLQHGLDDFPSGYTNQTIDGLTFSQPIVHGQYVRHNESLKRYGDWDISKQVFAKSAFGPPMCMLVQDVPVRLAIRVIPRAEYSSFGFLTGTDGNTPIVNWWPMNWFNASVQSNPTGLDLFEVTKISGCNIGQIESGMSGGSDGSIGSRDIGSLEDRDSGV